ncbi:Ig-like domain-containing protein, partial [Gemella sp.]
PAGNVSEASTPATATADTKAPAKPEIKTDLTDKAGTKTPVEVSAEPGSKVELFDKDGHKIGEGVADENGKAIITPTRKLPEGDVIAKATDPAGNVSEPSDAAKATPTTEVKAPEKIPVKDPSNLTDAEKEKVKEAVKKANPTATEVEVGKDGTVTVTLPDGTKATIPGSKTVEEELKGGVKAPEKTPVKDPSNLTDAEKEAVKEALIKANPKLKDPKVKITISAKGDATIVYPDGKVVVIPASDLVEVKVVNNRSNGTSEINGNSNAQATNAKLGQRLANTGTTETNTELAGLGLGILGGLFAARRRKNDKN